MQILFVWQAQQPDPGIFDNLAARGYITKQNQNRVLPVFLNTTPYTPFLFSHNNIFSKKKNMSYKPRRVGYYSPEEEDTVSLRRLTLPDYRNYQYANLEQQPAPQSPYEPCASPSIYELEKSPFADTIEQEAKVGRRPSTTAGGSRSRHTHHRKSWEESWEQAVQVGRWPRIIYAVIGVLFVIVWMIVTCVPPPRFLFLLS
jgi:hypothetical protein